MKRLLHIALAALSLFACAPAVASAADKPLVIESGQVKQLPAATALQLQAATTGNASVNLPQGAAPSSPADGDAWVTTQGLFYRANGITYGPVTMTSVTCGTPLTGGTITTTGACGIATNGLALSYLAQIGGSSYLGNQSTTTGNVTAYAFPTCADNAHMLNYNPSNVPPLQCPAVASVPAGTNPFAIGSASIESNVGSPSASSLGAGSLYMRTDRPTLYQLLVSSAAVPAVVQSASAGGNSVTMSATPSAGDFLVATCSNYTPTPSTAAGWTQVSTRNVITFDPSMTVQYKQATAGESTTQTPCSASAVTVVFEVSGVTTWAASYLGQTSAVNTGGTGSITVNYTTTNANTLILGSWAARCGTTGGSVTGLSGAATNASGSNASACIVGAAAAAQAFPTNGSNVSATGTIPSGSGIYATLIEIIPGASSWGQFSYLATIQNASSTISTLPSILNFSTGLSASASTGSNGLDTITVTATNAGTVTHTVGALTSGQLIVGNGSADVKTGDLTGDCTTSGSTATNCGKTGGVSFGYFATGTDAANLTGTVSVNRFNSGTGASSTTFLRGDGTWVTPAGAGTVTNTGTLTAGRLIIGNGTTDVTVGLTDVTTDNVSISAHGLVPKAPNDATKCLVGDGTWAACSGAGSSTLVAPQGRLTLVTGTPVLNSDQTAKSTIYYDCFRGNNVPYYNGTTDTLDTISSCEVSLTMQTSGTGVTNSGGVFDVVWVHAGANRICVVTNGSGGGWASDTGGSNTARGTGYSQFHNTRGYWTNVNSIAHCYNGTTDYGSISADQATLLGTLTTTAAGQTGMAFHPTAATGGANPFLGLWNAYNRVMVHSQTADTTASWAYGTTTWRAEDASNSNRVTWVDGLGQSAVSTAATGFEASANTGVMGVDCDSTSAAPNVEAQISVSSGIGSVSDSCAPAIGLHFAQQVEEGFGGSPTWLGAQSGGRQSNLLRVSLEMHLPLLLPLAAGRRRRRKSANDNRRLARAA